VTSLSFVKYILSHFVGIVKHFFHFLFGSQQYIVYTILPQKSTGKLHKHFGKSLCKTENLRISWKISQKGIDKWRTSR